MNLQFFDAREAFEVVERRLPHWSQSGAVCFITWRTWDSMPAQLLAEWQRERDQWLLKHGIDPQQADWQKKLDVLNPRLRSEFKNLLSDRWNKALDECHGQCLLRDARLAKIVSDSLLHFDGDRYELTDFVIMPNHVHLLAAFPDEAALLKQCESWKHFTAAAVNRMLERKGRFWQQDGFDHLVRSQAQFAHLRKYIAENPEEAKLKAGEYIHFSKLI